MYTKCLRKLVIKVGCIQPCSCMATPMELKAKLHFTRHNCSYNKAMSSVLALLVTTLNFHDGSHVIHYTLDSLLIVTLNREKIDKSESFPYIAIKFCT